MGTFARSAALSLAAALLLALATGASSARNLSIGNQQFRIVIPELQVSAIGETMRCPVTLEGSFSSSTITKSASSRIGSITTARNSTCTTGGGMTIAQETLPWPVVYSGFEGALPSISGWSQLLERLKFWLAKGTQICVAGTALVNSAKTFWKTLFGRSNRARFEARLPLNGELLCELAGEATFSGEGTLSVAGGTAEIAVTLI